jgi:hypothetical protein
VLLAGRGTVNGTGISDGHKDENVFVTKLIL